ncbi:MAG: hypothetical protein A2X64_05635 [Ignavibacteria bacterium GWF2_33_9]|nr:MAG: hypothetical protein A2X64_05635 [Ignavibacteria bacterium GWF2_33_9]
MQKLFTLFIFILFLPFLLFGQEENSNSIHPLKIEQAPELDGKLNEVCWQNAQKISKFLQVEPNNGELTTERTEVAVCFTSTHLYVGIWCYDANSEEIIRKGMKRDFADWRDDIFAVAIDTYREMNSGYLFEVNANGARYDAQVDVYGYNESWNGIWDCAAEVTPEGWFAELELPFSTLKFPEAKVQKWSINFARIIQHKNEKTRWQGWSRNNSVTTFRNAGLLDSLVNIKGKEILELKPYLLAGGNINPDDNKTVTKVGGDLNYQINNNIKANLTFNTDFAQVESDEMKINLTRFSLYYPEKRDFFLEGSTNLTMTIDGESDIFYSRRIGIHESKMVPIIAGAKVLGRIDNTNIGIMSIQTNKTNDLATTNYSVAKFDRQFNENFSLQGIGTGINRKDFYNYVYGGNFFWTTTKFLGENNLLIDGLIAQSQTKDADNSHNSVFSLYTAYPNELLNMELFFNQTQKNFDPQMGYLSRSNVKRMFGQITYRPRPNIPGVRRLSIQPIDMNVYWTDDTNELESAEFEVKPFGVELTTEDYFGLEFRRRFDRLDEDFELADDFIIPAGRYWFNSYALEINTFSGRKMTNWVWLQFGDYYDADYFNFYLTLAWNINKHLNISGEYSYNNLTRGDSKFMSNSILARIDYAFNPKANLGLFAQWNDEMDQLLLNFRVSLIPVIGSDIYLVINQTYSNLRVKAELLETVALLKVVWRFGI